MREFVVSKAPVERVAALARDTVENAGGVVAQHSSRTTEFDHLQPDEDEWARSGYIGTYQRYGEDPVRLRIRAWASGPRKFFLWIVFLGLIQAVLFFTLSFLQVPPPPNVWIVSALITIPLLAIAFQMYATSWSDSADLEDALARRLQSRILDDPEIEGDLYSLGEWEERREELIETAVQKAKQRAPERPSRAKKVVQTVAAGTRERAGRVVGQFRTEEDEAAAQQDEAPSEDEASRRLSDRVAFWRSGDEDDEEGPEPEDAASEQAAAADEQAQEAEAEPDEDADEGGLMDKVAFWRSTEEAQEEQAADTGVDEEAQAKQERLEELKRKRAEIEAEPDDEADEGGLMDKVAFWRSTQEGPDAEEEPAQASDAPTEDEAEAKKKRLEDLKRRRKELAQEDGSKEDGADDPAQADADTAKADAEDT